jgi:predicted Zn finger-like uncharacterized protein
MIIRCPSCSTRFDLPASRFDADGTMIKCSVCGHGWLEGRAIEITRELPMTLPVAVESSYEPEAEIRRLVDATREAHEWFASRRRKRRLAAAAWCALAFVGSTPVVYALTFPETVVKAAPASITMYEWMGKPINIYGLEIRHVDMQHLHVDGTRVLSVKGEIANTSSEQRKIPWLRFGLLGPTGQAEVYNWQLDTNARPLNPGEITNFVTRIASPPETAARIEIRFARANEIGSNTPP